MRQDEDAQSRVTDELCANSQSLFGVTTRGDQLVESVDGETVTHGNAFLVRPTRVHAFNNQRRSIRCAMKVQVRHMERLLNSPRELDWGGAVTESEMSSGVMRVARHFFQHRS